MKYRLLGKSGLRVSERELIPMSKALNLGGRIAWRTISSGATPDHLATGVVSLGLRSLP